MRTTVKVILVGGLLAGLAACGSGQTSASTAQAAPPPVSHTVFAPYVNDVHKAKNVQNVVNSQKQSLDQAIRNQTGDSSASPAPGAQSL